MEDVITANNETDKPVPYSDEFLSRIRELEKAIRDKHLTMSKRKTPKSKKRRDKASGFDYVKEHWLRDQMNRYFPLWSWEGVPGHTIQIIGEWIIVDGELVIYDNGIKRKFYSAGAARVQFKKGSDHTPINVVDLDNNAAAAVTNALKRAINRLCNISDDVYRKEFEETVKKETLDEIIRLLPFMPEEKEASINSWLKKKHDDLLEMEAQDVLSRMKEFC